MWIKCCLPHSAQHKAKQEILYEHVRYYCTLHTLKVLQRKKMTPTSANDNFKFNSLNHVQVQRKKRKLDAYTTRFYFFLLQRFCMAVLTHLNPPCWKWIWHMRNEDFGPYSAHLNRTYTDRFVTFKNISMNTTRMCKLKCWYSRVNIVSFEIERRSNGS